MKTMHIACDNCQRNLTESSSRPDYRLVLHAERIPTESEVSLDVTVHPPIEEDAHFCSTGCLSQWLIKFHAYKG